MSSRPKKDPAILDFSSLRAVVDGLLFNLERDLRRRSEKTTDSDSARGLVLLRTAVRTIQNSYDAMRFMCADEQGQGQSDNYALLLPVINRMLLEVLFTVMFWLDDFPGRCVEYQRAGWRELAEERQGYKAEYSNAPEWKQFFRSVETQLKTGVKELGISDKEAQRPQNIEYWKSGARLIEQLKGETGVFARWLDKWFYHETSSIAHFDPAGVQKIGFHLVADQAPQGLSVSPEDIRRLRDFQISTTLMIIACLASELEAHLYLNNLDAIKGLWTTLRKAIPDAAEMCKRRYDKLFAMAE